MKKLTSIILAVVVLTLTVTANAAYVNNTYISSQGACVMDYSTGDVLYELNGSTRRVPASMTKLMTVYCLYRAIDNGTISWDTTVPISRNVYNKSRDKLYQNMLALNMDTKYTVDELLGVCLTYSASAATVALAELLGGGSEAQFVKTMNATAKELGIDATYYDSCGVADNLISPTSMATLARRLIMDYPDVLNRTSKKSVYFHGSTYSTTNYLLKSTYYYEGADGLKTGTGNAAGACFCGTAYKNGRRLIIVTMGSSTKDQRFVDAGRLFDYGYLVAMDKYGAIAYTDIATMIDGVEIPTWYKRGENPHAVVMVSDFANYGFDVTYDDSTRTVIIEQNSDKQISPIPLDIYKNRDGNFAFSILDSDIRVVLKSGDNTHQFADIYNANGYMCVSADEFAGAYSCLWNGETRTLCVTTK